MLEIGWKSFGSRKKIFLHLQLSSEVVTKSLAIFGSCWKSSAIYGSRPKSLKIFGSRQEIFRNSGSVETKNLTHLTEKKLAGLKYMKLDLCKFF